MDQFSPKNNPILDKIWVNILDSLLSSSVILGVIFHPSVDVHSYCYDEAMVSSNFQKNAMPGSKVFQQNFALIEDDLCYLFCHYNLNIKCILM